MSAQPWSAPAAASGLDFKDLNGHLLLVTVHTLETGIKTVHGEKEAVRADVVDLDTNEEHVDTLIFPSVLIGQLRSAAGGKKVLGRLGQGAAKPGQNPPWKLADPTEADGKKAGAYLAGDIHTPTADEPPF